MAEGNEQNGRAPTLQSIENDVTNDVTEVARYELLAERPVIDKRRELAGRVAVRKEVERHTETVSVELITERLIIEVKAGDAGVWLDGEQLGEGDTREIVVYREEAAVGKRTVVSEQVRLLRRAVSEQRALDLELGREVLRFEDVALGGSAASALGGQSLVRREGVQEEGGETKPG